MHNKGLTVWEMLVALAILSILGTVAVSETSVSLIRARIARVRADMTRVASALESYALDYRGAYPHVKVYVYLSTQPGAPGQMDRAGLAFVTNLSSPVAYLADSRVPDPFNQTFDYHPFTGGAALNQFPSMYYLNVNLNREVAIMKKNPANRPSWYLHSTGPDGFKSMTSYFNYMTGIDADRSCHFVTWQYDPSNGTLSGGDILKYPL